MNPSRLEFQCPEFEQIDSNRHQHYKQNRAHRQQIEQTRSSKKRISRFSQCCCNGDINHIIKLIAHSPPHIRSDCPRQADTHQCHRNLARGTSKEKNQHRQYEQHRRCGSIDQRHKTQEKRSAEGIAKGIATSKTRLEIATSELQRQQCSPAAQPLLAPKQAARTERKHHHCDIGSAHIEVVTHRRSRNQVGRRDCCQKDRCHRPAVVRTLKRSQQSPKRCLDRHRRQWRIERQSEQQSEHRQHKRGCQRQKKRLARYVDLRGQNSRICFNSQLKKRFARHMGGFCCFRFSNSFSTCETQTPISKKAVRAHSFGQPRTAQFSIPITTPCRSALRPDRCRGGNIYLRN